MKLLKQDVQNCEMAVLPASADPTLRMIMADLKAARELSLKLLELEAEDDINAADFMEARKAAKLAASEQSRAGLISKPSWRDGAGKWMAERDKERTK